LMAGGLMARKIRKPATSLPRLFFYLLFPWLVMGALALLTYDLGMSSLWIFAISLGGALLVTYAISLYERRRRRALALMLKDRME